MVARTEVLQRNIPEDWSLKDRTLCKENLHRGGEDDIVKIVQMERAKCIYTWEPTGVKGQSNRAGMGLGQSAQASRPGLLQGSVQPSFSCTWRSFNPKLLEAPPFARQRAIRPRDHPQARQKGREIVRKKDRPTRKKHPQVEEKEDVRSVTMINGDMSSTLMGVILSFVHGL
jgi:hypothetical protein